LDLRLQIIRHSSKPRIVITAKAPQSGSELKLVRSYRDWDEIELAAAPLRPPCPSNIKPGTGYPVPQDDISHFIEISRWWLDKAADPNNYVWADIWTGVRKRLPKAELNMGGPCSLVIEDKCVFLRPGRGGAKEILTKPGTPFDHQMASDDLVRATGSTGFSADGCQRLVDTLGYAIKPNGQPPEIDVYPSNYVYDPDSSTIRAMPSVSYATMVGLFITDDRIVLRPAPEDTDPDDPRAVVVVRIDKHAGGTYIATIATNGQHLWRVGKSKTVFIATPQLSSVETLSPGDVDLILMLAQKEREWLRQERGTCAASAQ